MQSIFNLPRRWQCKTLDPEAITGHGHLYPWCLAPSSITAELLAASASQQPPTHQQHPHPRLTISYLARERSLWNRSNSRRSWMVTSSFQSASRMMPISTTLPITASTMVTALGAELQAGSEGEKLISSGVSVSQIRISGCNNLDCSHRASDLRQH